MAVMQSAPGLILLFVLVNANCSALAADDAMVELSFAVHDARGKSLPCRIHLLDPAGKPVQAPGQPFWKDHFCCSGRVAIKLPAGKYRYEIERGPEHERVAESVELRARRDHSVNVRLDRVADLKRHGWYCGDLHIHR